MLLFISDAHIGIGKPEDQQKRKQYLFECLDHYAPEIEKLYILGDLFDFWFEWRHVILKRHFAVLCKLREIAARGIEIHFLAGNHDFALSEFLCAEIGAEIHFDEYSFTYDDKQFYLLHGDGLAPADWGYRILKKILRNPTNQKLFALFHPDFGLEMAHRSSHTSRNYSGRRWDIDGWAYLEAAQERLKNGNDYVLFAHNHEPMLKPLDGGIYLNTGEWMKQFSYATYDREGMTLRYWTRPFMKRSEHDWK
ncbi:UDP-2,3-diacylglucosamine diphosphatase [bacterium]|nr:UDP-2,3-diacylglucosamine diphosphatase [bacterium]